MVDFVGSSGLIVEKGKNNRFLNLEKLEEIIFRPVRSEEFKFVL